MANISFNIAQMFCYDVNLLSIPHGLVLYSFHNTSVFGQTRYHIASFWIMSQSLRINWSMCLLILFK